MNLKKLAQFLDTYLKINDIKDMAWNGLQFEGKAEVKKIATAVDACQDAFEKAAKIGADLLITHHANFWRFESLSPVLTGWHKRRIDLLYKNNLSLYCAHLPLDRHPVVGNNAQLLKIIGANRTKGLFMEEGKNVGWMGEYKTPKAVSDIIKTLEREIQTKCTSLLFGPKKVRRVAICSGGGSTKDFLEAIAAGADLFITGDRNEHYQLAKDMRVNCIFAGHNRTEIVGVKALGKLIEKKFKLRHTFIDLPTGL